MKKLFMFLAVAGLATFGASCSSSDDNGGGKEPQLTLKADKTSIKVDETVKFTVEVAGKAETGAELYKDGTKIANPYKFTEEGEFSIVAKKKGSLDSQAVKITVTKGEPVKETLVLTADKNAVNVGGKVKFTVKDNKGNAVAGFKIKQVGGADLAGDEWTAAAAGTFKFVASKDNYVGSNEVSVEVTDAPGGNIVLALVTNPADIFEGTPFELSIKDANGAGIDGAELLIDGRSNGNNPIMSTEGGKFVINGPEGEYNFTATIDGKVSNAVVVVVKPAEPIDADMTGNFVYAGTTYEATEGYLGFMGLAYADATQTTVVARWQIEVETAGEMSALVAFTTPATPAEGEGMYNYEIPSATNTTAKAVAVFRGNTNVGETNTGITFSLNTTPNADRSIFTGTSATTANVSNAPFSMNLEGDFVYFRANTGGNGARAAKTFQSVNVEKVKKATSTKVAKFIR